MKDGRLSIRWKDITDVEATLGKIDLLEAMEIRSITVRLTAADYPAVIIEVVPSSLELELEETNAEYRGELLEEIPEALIWEQAPSGREEWASWPSQTAALEEE